jgi:hypothetical protein
MGWINDGCSSMRKEIVHLAAGVTLSFVVFVLPPLSVYAPDAAEFGLSSLTLLWPFLALFVAGTVVAALLSRAFSFSSLVLVFYVCASIVALVVSQSFSQPSRFMLDGALHEYRPSTFRALGELVFIAAVFVLGFSFRRRIDENRGFVTLTISMWAIAAAAVPTLTYIEAGEPGNRKALDSLVRLSPTLNVLHIMFDSLQSDAFMKILERDQAVRDEFDGFVLYREHSGYSNWTSISLPAILAGHLYFEESTEQAATATDVVRRWMDEDSLMARLARRGFAASSVQPGLLFCEGATFPCTTLAQNVDELRQAGKNASGAQLEDHPGLLTGAHALLADLALLRLAPSIAKGAVYNDGRLLLTQRSKGSFDDLSPIQRDLVLSRNFVSYLTQNLSVSSKAPIYKFIHFFPPHKPFIFNSACELRASSLVDGGGAEENWDHYFEQAGCATRLLAELLRTLKELGVYDNTIFILQADTGLGMVPPSEGDKGERIASELGNLTPSRLMAYAHPAFAIKRLGRHGALTISDELTHHRDTVPMVLSAIDEAGEAQPPNRADPQSEAGRTPRPFVVSDALRPGIHRIKPFEAFEINGSLRDFSNWTRKGIYSAPGTLAKGMRPIEALSIDVAPKGDISVGDTITISAKVSGGEPDRLYLFFHRSGDDELGLIQNWSYKDVAQWTVGETHHNPCALELLLAVRNEGSKESTAKTAELTLPLKRPQCPERRMRPIEALSIDVAPKDDISVGDTITLSAKVSGGEPDRLYLFFHRSGDDELGLIQNWSYKDVAQWTVGETHRNPCALELLLAVRNEGSKESTAKTAELTVPLKRPQCPERLVH